MTLLTGCSPNGSLQQSPAPSAESAARTFATAVIEGKPALLDGLTTRPVSAAELTVMREAVLGEPAPRRVTELSVFSAVDESEARGLRYRTFVLDSLTTTPSIKAADLGEHPLQIIVGKQGAGWVVVTEPNANE